MNWTLLSLWVHIPVVTAWIGLVMWDFFASTAPGLAATQRGRLIAWSRPFTILAIVVIMITGIRQTMDNPFQWVGSYAELQELKKLTYGNALFWKHICVFISFGLALPVRFWLAPRLLSGRDARDDDGIVVSPGGTAALATPAVAQTERLISGISAVNLIFCVGALIFATRMIWTLH